MLRRKGKLISQKQYNQRFAAAERLKKKRKIEEVPIGDENPPVEEESVTINEVPGMRDNITSNNSHCMEGRRIIEYKTLGEQMWCKSCKGALSLSYIESEERRGLGSILKVRCHICLLVNTDIKSCKQYSTKSIGSSRFAVNAKLALGLLHAGMGWAKLCKLFACLDIPTGSFHTFKKHEEEVGLAVEEVAKQSCQEAAVLEKTLALEKIDKIEKLLPEDLRGWFLLPDDSIPDPSTADSLTNELETETLNLTPTITQKKTDTKIGTVEETVQDETKTDSTKDTSTIDNTQAENNTAVQTPATDINKTITLNPQNEIEPFKQSDTRQNAQSFSINLTPLKKVISSVILKKMAFASIIVESLRHAFSKGPDVVEEILRREINGKPVVTSHKATIEKMLDWLANNK